MRILFVGDVVGKAGKAMLFSSLKKLEGRYDFLIVNGENITHGKGLSKADYQELVSNNVDAITLGNHYRGQEEIDHYIDKVDRLVRPLNVISYYHGLGSRLFKKGDIEIRVTNLLGSAFMKEAILPPHDVLSSLIGRIKPCIHIVDYHAESTSEKQIFMQAFASKVTAIVGTHTHVASADSRIVKGSAIQSDVGMVGLRDGSIGATFESAYSRFVEKKYSSLDFEGMGLCQFNATLIEVDEETYQAKSIERIYLEEEINE